MIVTEFDPRIPVEIAVIMFADQVRILVNQQLYSRVRPDLRGALWNRAFADCGKMPVRGRRDDLAVRREARALVEQRIAEQAAVPTERRAVRRLSIADTTNIIPSVSGERS